MDIMVALCQMLLDIFSHDATALQETYMKDTQPLTAEIELQMLLRSSLLQWSHTPGFCVICSTICHAVQPVVYPCKPSILIRRRDLHLSRARRRPAAQPAVQQPQDTEEYTTPRATPRSRFGAFAARNTATPALRDELASDNGRGGPSSTSKPGGKDSDDALDWGDAKDKAALRTRQMTNGEARKTSRQLPALDDPRLRPPRPEQEGEMQGRTLSSRLRDDAARAQAIARGAPGRKDAAALKKEYASPSLQTSSESSAHPRRDREQTQEPLGSSDVHERATLRRTSPRQSRRDSTGQDTSRSRWHSSARVDSQINSFSRNINKGEFKFGLDDARIAAGRTGRGRAGESPAPWGQHLKVRRPAVVGSDLPVEDSSPKNKAPGTTVKLPDEVRRAVQDRKLKDVAAHSNENTGFTKSSADVVRLDSLFQEDRADSQHARTRRRDQDERQSSVEKVSKQSSSDADADIDLRPRERRQSRRRAMYEEDESAEDAFALFNNRREKKQSRPAARYKKADEDDGNFDEDYVPKKERKSKKAKKEARAEEGPRLTPIVIPPFISVQNLATALKIRPEDFVQKLEGLGFEQTSMDHVMNAESAGLIAMEFDYEPVIDRSATEDLLPRAPPPDNADLPPRPSVVTIMGHVDHGKTTLLDYLRKSSVAASEHGGITQHIGAFSVPIASANNRMVTFLDTPGHAAFLSMRQRGANVTDIVVLVVAADDSVKPQTIEAIRHAKKSGVQIIVAISKVDKDDADVYRVKQDLIQHDIEVEDFGGSIQAVEVSGKTGQGIPDLEEAIITLSDVLEVRAEAEGAAEGWVLEAATKRAGRSATVLVRRGILRPGDILVAGTTWTRVRNLRNEAGLNISEATPGMPVEVDGWRDQPAAGDEVLGAETEARATSVVAYRQTRAERLRTSSDMEAINDIRRSDAERRVREKDAAAKAEEEARAAGAKRKEIGIATRAAKEQVNEAARTAAADKVTTLYLIVKADVSGSTEAVAAMINSLPLGGHPVAISILREGVGPISESDIAHMAATPAGDGYIVNFNQPVPSAMASLAEKNGVHVIDETIIYKVVDDIRAAVEERLPPLITTRVIGEAETAQVFEIKDRKKTSKVAGCQVKNGTVGRNNLVRVFRGGIGADGTLIFEGKLASLRNQKKDVNEMRKGTECGLSFEGWDDFIAGDMIQCYEEQSQPRKLV